MACFLVRGSRNNVVGKVKDVQSKLKRLGYYKYSIDGDYGKYTEAAVKAYQKSRGLVVDGCVGPQTWNSLFPATTITKTALLQRIERAVGGEFKTATEFYNLVKANESYSGYKNDVYTQGEALTRLEKNLPLNCADFSQIGHAAILELNKVYKKNYSVQYLRVECKDKRGKPNPKAGHIILRVLGGEFKTWTYFDVAEAASAGKAIGQTMCTYGFKVTHVNPTWLLSDDRKT